MPNPEPATALAMVLTETWTAFSLGTVLRAVGADSELTRAPILGVIHQGRGSAAAFVQFRAVM